VRVVVADDAVLIRSGLVRLLEEFGCEVVAEVGDGDALVEAVAEHRPDVSVVDVRMPPSFTDEGLRAATRARELVPGAPVGDGHPVPGGLSVGLGGTGGGLRHRCQRTAHR